MNPVQFIQKVRRRLNNPKAQAPTDRQILDRGIAAYQNATMKANNTGNAWAVKEFVLTSTVDVRRYDVPATDFGKALLVATVPSSTPGVAEPEYPLEFTEIEQLPRDWAWLSDTGWWWSMWWANVSQRGRYVAFWREVVSGTGFKNCMEIRPTPQADEQYRVLYQVGDWSGNITSSLAFQFPFSGLDDHFVTLVSDDLLGVAEWTDDEASNAAQSAKLERSYAKSLMQSQPIFDDFIASLHEPEIVYAESFADNFGPG